MDRIIDKDEPAAIERWSVPPVDGSAADTLRGARERGAHLLTARQLEELQRLAQEEARQRGLEEGLAAASREVAARVERLTALADALAHPLEHLGQQVEQELIDVAVALASHVIRREIARDAAPTVDAVRECLAALPSGTRDVVLYLNPEDASLVGTHLDLDRPRPWKLESDPSLSRGDLRLSSSSSQVDGRLEARLREIVATARADLELGEAEP
jgi:flagellar assembly protein FliH